MPYPSHSVKVETQVVDGVQNLPQYFIRTIEMAQVGARIAPANTAVAIWVKRSLVLGIARLLDGDFSLGGKQQPVTRCPRGQDAVHNVDSETRVFDDLLRRSHPHQIARLVGGKMLQRRFNDLPGQVPRLAHAQSSDR